MQADWLNVEGWWTLSGKRIFEDLNVPILCCPAVPGLQPEHLA